MHAQRSLILVVLMVALVANAGAAAQTAVTQQPTPSQVAAATAAAGQGAQQQAPDPQWVSASAPQDAGGFPSAQAVTVPQAPNFQAQPNGPENYGGTVGETPVAGGQPQPSGPAGQPTIPPPPLINQARDVVSPFTAPEIKELHQDFDETRRAKAQQPVTTVPRISSIAVDLSPGGAPPLVRTARNETSTVVFLDSTGAPWPLAASPRLASDAYFDVHWLNGTAAIVITAKSSYEQVGVAVFLKGLATPVMLKVSSGDPDSDAKTRIVDYRLDLHVPGRGPNAKASILGPAQIGLYDDALQAFLDGTPPAGAKPISIEGGAPAHTQVWQLGDSFYLRTPLSIRSAFDETTSSADGMHVYKLAPTPLIALSQGGDNLSLSLDIE
jgi:intracellular multiplication protein IcmK